MVIAFLVMGHCRPVDSFRCAGRIFAFAEDVLVMFLGFSPLLLHKGDPAKGKRQLRSKFPFRQIALDAITFLARGVEKQYARGPEHIKTMEMCRRFLDVDVYGKKILIDEVCQLVIAIGFGFQPNASPSGGGGTEVKQYGFVCAFGLRERSIRFFDPLHGHSRTSEVKNLCF